MSQTQTQGPAILRGVDTSKADRKSLTKTIKTLSIACDTSIDSMVSSLADHLIKLHKKTPNELLRCDWCGGSSDVSFSKCPYCGLDDKTASAKLAAEEAKKPVAPEPEKPAANAKPPKKARGAEKADTPHTSPTKEARVAKAEKPGVKKAGTAIEKVHKAELVTAVDLDNAIVEIKQFQVDIVDSHWLLGQKLSEVHEKNLYALRLDEAGKPKYKNFGQWVASELEITPRYALDLAAVSKVFTEETIKEVGVTKLRVLARIPEEAKRANLVAAAKGELTGGTPLTRKQLNAAATKDGPLPPRPGIGNHQQTEEGVKVRAEKAAARAAEKGVTVVIQPGRTTIPLYSGMRAKELEPMRAFDVGDEPVGLEDTLNGLKIRYLLEKDADGLVLVIERTRES